jgi:S1-C subfamily serine protease
MKKATSLLLHSFLLLPVLIAGSAGGVRAETGIESSMVRIVNHSQRGNWYSPWNVSSAREGSGSGFVVEGGRVMTNAHVVSDSRMCLIYLHGDPTPYPAKVAVVGHDCDLALLEPEDSRILEGIPPMSFGSQPAIRSVVETYGYAAGGVRLSSTRGVVSRIEVQQFVHSAMDSHLTVQTDAAINPGNSGGPVVQDGRVVGIAFQGSPGLENVGFFIPPEVVRHFLEDAADGTYDGYPDLGILTSNLENPAARARAGMAEGESGVSVDFVFQGSSADGRLVEGDVILAVEGEAVANDGTVRTDGLRFEFSILIDRLQSGEKLSLTILRGGRRFDMQVALFPLEPYRRRYANIYDRLPRYYIYAGLVFVPLNLETLKTYGGQWRAKAGKPLIYEHFYRPLAEPERLGREPVILLRVLDHPVNMDLAWRQSVLVERVNGQTIDGLDALVEAFESHEGDHHVIEFGESGEFDVLDRRATDPAHPEILELYGVFKDRRL